MKKWSTRFADDLVSVCKPRKLKVVGDFNVRGGIYTSVSVDYVKDKKKTRKK